MHGELDEEGKDEQIVSKGMVCTFVSFMEACFWSGCLYYPLFFCFIFITQELEKILG